MSKGFGRCGLAAFLLLAGCEALETPGTLTIEFDWEDLPEETVYVWARIEHRPPGTEPPYTTLALSGPVEFVPGGTLDLSVGNVPYGDDRVLLVEVREEPQTTFRVVYFGASEPFSIQPGQDTTVAVALQIQAPENLLVGGGVELSFAGDSDRTQVSYDELAKATVTFEITGATSAVLANSPTFAAGTETVKLDGTDPKVSCEGQEPIVCVWEGWDLLAGLGEPHDGTYAVYVKFVNAAGYETDFFKDEVQADGTGPATVSADVTPPIARPGKGFSVTVSASEVLDLSKSSLSLVPIGDTTGAPKLVASGRIGSSLAYLWTGVIPAGSHGAAWNVTGVLSDVLGNVTEIDLLTTGSAESAALELRVDGLPPSLSGDPAIVYEAAVFALEDDGSTFSFDFAFVEEHASELPDPALPCDETCPIVRLDGRDLGKVVRKPELDDPGAGRFGFHYSYTLDVDGDWQGSALGVPVTLRWTDAAGNQSEPFQAPKPVFDFVAPEASCSILPEDRPAGLGEKVQVLVTTTEAMAPGFPFVETTGADFTISSPGTSTLSLSAGPFPPGTESSLTYAVDLMDAAGNFRNAACTGEASVDTVPPAVSEASLEPSKPALTAADALAIEFAVSEPLQEPPSVKVGQVAAAIEETSELHFRATVPAGALPAGVFSVTIGLVDRALNQAFDTSKVPAVKVDVEPPGATCPSSHDDGEVVRAGEQVSIVVSANEAVLKDATSIAAGGVLAFHTVTTSSFGGTMASDVAAEGLEGSYTWTVDLTDEAGNVAPVVCQGGGEVDAIFPSLVFGGFEGAESTYKPGDEVAFSFSVSEPLAGPPAVTVGGAAAAVSSGEGPLDFTAAYAVPEDAGDGLRVVSVTLADPAGNSRTYDALVPPVTFDTTPPILSCQKGDDGAIYGKGSLVSVLLSVNEPLAPGFPKMSDEGVDFEEKVDGLTTTWTAKLVEAGIVGDFSWSVEVVDLAGNAAVETCSGWGSIDTEAPSVTAGEDAVSPRSVKAGDTISIAFDTSADVVEPPEVTLGTTLVELDSHEGTTWKFKGYPAAGNDSGVQKVQVSLVDLAGNAVVDTSSLGTVDLDLEAPSAECSVTHDDAHPVGLGQQVLLTVNASEKLAPGYPEVVATGLDFAPSSTSGLSTGFSAPVTEAGQIGGFTWYVDLVDEAGNSSTKVCQGTGLVDTVLPKIASKTPPAKSLYAAGSKVSLGFSSSEALEGTPTVTIGESAAAVVKGPGLSWTASLDVVFAQGAGVKPISVRLVDPAQNAVLDTASFASLTFDFEAPASVSGTINFPVTGAGSNLQVLLTASEPLAAPPSLVAKRLDASLTFAPDDATPGQVSYGYSHVVLPGTPDGTWTFEPLLVTDVAGNEGTVALNGGVGLSFALDSTAPEVLALDVPETRTDETGLLTFVVTVSEVVLEEDLSVKLGGVPLSCEAEDDGAVWVCSYEVTGLEAAPGTTKTAPLLVVVKDAAGNAGGASDAVVFDFQDPAFACTPSHDSANPAGIGAEISLHCTSSEPLAAAPVFDAPGLPLSLVASGETTFDYAGPAPPATDGELGWSIQGTDLAGNTSAPLAGELGIDTIAPQLLQAVRALDGDPVAKYAKAGVLLTVDLEVSEPLPAPPEVTLGGVPVPSTGGPPWTYSHVVAPNDDNGVRKIAVTFSDDAGNEVQVPSATAPVTVDTVPPAIALLSVAPAIVTAAHLATISVSADEPLSATPKLSFSKDGVPEVVVAAPLSPPVGLSHTFTATTELEDGFWTIEAIELVDLAGNVSSPPDTATLEVDSTPPVIADLALDPTRVGLGDVVTISFATPGSEFLPVVKVAGTKLDANVACKVDFSIAGGWECSYSVTGAETPAGTEASLPVQISVQDPAGNSTTESTTLVFDFEAPDVVSATVTLVADTTNPLPSVTSVKANTTIEVTVIADEPLAASGLSLEAAGPGGALLPIPLFDGPDGSAAVFRVVHTNTALADGTYNLRVSWKDTSGAAGNAAEDLPVGKSFAIDTKPSTLYVYQPGFVYVRSPWGNDTPEDLGGWTIPAGASFELAPEATLSGQSSFDAGDFQLFDGTPLHRVRVWAEQNRTTLLGTLTPIGGLGGKWPRTQLANVDATSIYVSGIDAAGNETPAVKIQQTEWVSTPNDSAFEEAQEYTATRLATNGIEPVGANEYTFYRDWVIGADEQADVFEGSGVWRPFPSSISPEPRYRAAAAWDAARGELVLFGGSRNGIFHTDTLRWNGDVWGSVPFGDLDELPTGVEGGVMAYDPVRGRTVLFGGDNAATGITQSFEGYAIWEFDGASWREHVVQISDREGSAMVWDGSRQKLVIYGGSAHEDGGMHFLEGDTWTWDGTEPVLLVGEGSGPGERTYARMAWRSKTGEVVLFGGFFFWTDDDAAPGGVSGETWTLSGSTWTKKNVTGPPARGAHAMGYDPVRDRVVVYGGLLSGGTRASDVWEWDGTSWSQKSPPNSPHPGALEHATFVWDAVGERLVLFGGWDGTSEFSVDLWGWDGSAWSKLSPADSAPPSGRSYAGMAFDAAREEVLVQGGDALGIGVNDELYAFDGRRWSLLTQGAVKPSKRKGAAMVYDSKNKEVLLVGGTDGTTVFNETWRWNGTSWTKNATSAGALWGSAIAWDSTRDRAILFGGYGNASGGTVSSGTKIYSASTKTWSTVAEDPDPAKNPNKRAEAGMAYDPVRDRIVLSGGISCTSGTCDGDLEDTWEFDGTKWTQILDQSGRIGNRLEWDPVIEAVVRTGGRTLNGIALGEVHTWDGNDWTIIGHMGQNGVENRSAHGMAYAFGRMRVFGGEGDNGKLDSFEELLFEPDRRPAFTFLAAGPQIPVDPPYDEIDTSLIQSLRVRAWCGGSFTSSAGVLSHGATLYGWAGTSAPGSSSPAPTAAWEPLGTSTASSFFDSGASSLPIDWTSSSAAEALRYYRRRDALWTFQCRTTPGPSLSDPVPSAELGADFIEVRVRTSGF